MNVSEDLDRRFRERAAAEGLLDVAYDLVDTPLGALLVAVTDRGVCRIEFDPEPDASNPPDAEREPLPRAVSDLAQPPAEPGDEALDDDEEPDDDPPPPTLKKRIT